MAAPGQVECPDEPSGYNVAVTRRRAAEQALEVEHQRHQRAVQEIEGELIMLNQQIAAADHGLCSAVDVEIGQKVLRVEWWSHPQQGRRRTVEVHQQFAAAIRDLQEGCPRLRQRYFGIKSYASWHSQIADCEYGMAPRHGSVWFWIGLRRTRSAAELTVEDRQACIRYLRAVEADPGKLLN